MAELLKDFRGKITAETWCFIEVEHRMTGADHSAIVRDVMHKWATDKLEAARLAHRILEGEGLRGITK